MRWRALRNGALGRCGNCGASGLFEGYFTLRERCPSCALAFEREEGYWVGAMVVNIGLTEVLFGLWLVGGMVVTWPDVPWTLLLVGGVLLNLIVPVAYYPLSKTTWVGLHLAFVRPEPSEEAEAIAALDQQRRAAAIAARDAREAAATSGSGHEPRRSGDARSAGDDGGSTGDDGGSAGDDERSAGGDASSDRHGPSTSDDEPPAD